MDKDKRFGKFWTLEEIATIELNDSAYDGDASTTARELACALIEAQGRIAELEEGQRADSGAECREFRAHDRVAGIDKGGCYQILPNGVRGDADPACVLKVAESQIRGLEGKVRELERDLETALLNKPVTMLKLDDDQARLIEAQGRIEELEGTLNRVRELPWRWRKLSKCEGMDLGLSVAQKSCAEELESELGPLSPSEFARRAREAGHDMLGLNDHKHESYVVYDPAARKYLAQDYHKTFWVDTLDCAVTFEGAEDAEGGMEEMMRAGHGPMEIRRVGVVEIVRTV
jgi:hypothetical protein